MGIDAATPPGFWERIRQMIRDEVAKLLRSGLLRSASISEGGLTIKGGTLRVLYPADQGGSPGVYFGNTVGAETGQYTGTGLLIQSPNGTDIATFRSDVVSGYPLVILRDAAGNGVLFTDTSAGQGLARPYVAGQFHAARFADWSYSVSVGDWTTVAVAYVFKQHPSLSVGVRASMDTAGTTGEVRVLVENVQHDAVTTEGFATANRYFSGPVPGAHMEVLTVQIQGRRTSATGTLKLEPIYWVGRQP